jgi:aminopeptidase
VDPRTEQLAKVLVHYSLGVKKDDWVIITGAYLAEDLIRAAGLEVLAAGGHPTFNVSIPEVGSLFMHQASKEQLSFVAPSDLLQYRKADKFLFIMGGWNSRAMTTVDPARTVLAQKSRHQLFQTLMKRQATGEASWVGTQFPTHSSAQDAEMSLHEYADFVYNAGMLHKKDSVAQWRRLSQRQARICEFLDKLETLRIVGEDTDITFNVAGRKWINCDGHVNFPDGEVFTGPVEDSAEGHIRYSFPAVYGGRAVENVRLTFKHGKVVDAAADKGEELLLKMLDTDPGARRVGELAFGTNPDIQRFTRNTLFDEKIGGTVHVALGASIPESGGKNHSAIHWDMVCDTRRDSTVYGDGQVIRKNGRFVLG